MDNPKCIAWLSSFPKSGNTWVRVFLANYILNEDEPVSINRLGAVTLGDSQLRTYQRLDPQIDPSDELSIVKQREAMLRTQLGNPKNLHLFKTHNTNLQIAEIDLIPPGLTRLGIYIVRHPLDVLVSYADHYGLALEHAAEAMCSEHNRVTPRDGMVTQYLGAWSTHVQSWMGSSSFPVHVVRYEDMQTSSYKTFRMILIKLGLPLDKERIKKAIRFSTFDQLREQEATSSFIERSENSSAFFRSGQVGAWKDVLDEDVVRAFRDQHSKTMKKYGYV